jgi:translocation and assembly module TamB
MVFGTELLLVEGLDLRAGAQAIHVDLRRAGSDARVDGRVAVSGLDLARLPRIVQPRGQALGGRLDLRAQLSGTRRKPALEAHVALADGRVGETRDLALSLDVAASRARASGTFAARGLSTSARGTFDVPATWPPRDARAPVRVDLALEPSDLGALSRELRLPGPKLAGRAALSLQVRGTAGAPEARAEITTRGLVVGDAALGDPRVSLTAVRGAPTRLQVDVPKSAAAPMSGSVALETPASLHRLLFEPMSLEAALRTPFSARGELAGVPLSLIARALRLDAIRGTGALRLDVTGTPRELTGAVNAQVRGAASDAFPPTDARVDVALGRRDTRVAARVWRQGRQAPLVAMSAIWGTPAARLLAGRAAFEAAAASAPLDVRIYGGPVQLKHKTFITSKEGSPAGDLHASARVTAEITGTLRQPVVEAVGDVSRARVGNQDVGDARVRLRYADAQAKLTARAQSAGGGTLQLDATAHADLGYPRVAALDPDHLPVEASLEARAFDLAWLSGLTGAVSRVAGKLDASVDLRGALRDPALAGRVEWKDGALAVTEIGEYRDVHVAVHAGNGRITIDDVRASSGSGTARLTGDATRAPDGHLVVSANAQLSRFPIYGQGEVLGTLSTRLALRANASLAGAKGRLEIEEAKAELGQLRRKDVQSLDRPANVVLVAGGRPINEEEKKKLIALQASRRARDGKGALPAGGDAGPPPWEAEVQVVAPRNLWVRGQDAELELGLSEGFRIEVGPALRMFGAISVRRGTVSVLGRRFTLQKDSTVTFHGPPDEPSLDIVARHENERAKVAVNVTVRGTPEDLRIDVSSPDRPDLNQTQLYSLIVTGQLDVGERSTAGATSLSNEAASLVGGLLASSIQKTLRKRLPLDVLTIQAGTGLTGSRLEAGTYIGSRLYVGYVGRVGSDPILLQNRNAVRVEYQFSPRWSLDAEYGDVGTGIADLLWNKHY